MTEPNTPNTNTKTPNTSNPGAVGNPATNQRTPSATGSMSPEGSARNGGDAAGSVPPLTSGRRDETLGSGRDGSRPQGGLQSTTTPPMGGNAAGKNRSTGQGDQATGDAVYGGGTTPGDDDGEERDRDGEEDADRFPSRSKPGTTPESIPVSGKMSNPSAPGTPRA